MILGLFPLKPADKIVCFDLIFYVFFFFNQYFVPYRTESDRIGPYRTKSGPISDRFRSNRATLKKKKKLSMAARRIHANPTRVCQPNRHTGASLGFSLWPPPQCHHKSAFKNPITPQQQCHNSMVSNPWELSLLTPSTHRTSAQLFHSYSGGSTYFIRMATKHPLVVVQLF